MPKSPSKDAKDQVDTQCLTYRVPCICREIDRLPPPADFSSAEADRWQERQDLTLCEHAVQAHLWRQRS